MTTLGPYEVHPFADALPLMDGDEFTDLVTDIKKHGLREPILLTHDRAMIIDGRNRYHACWEAQADPVFELLDQRYTEIMILDLIVSKNLARRHLNPGQKALLALTYEKMYAEATKAGYPAGRDRTLSAAETPPDLEEFRLQNEAASRAAQVTGASRSMVHYAKAVERGAPDLAPQVRSGNLAMTAAYQRARARERSQPTPKPEPAPKPTPVTLTLYTHERRAVLYPQPAAKATFNQTTGDGISWAAWSWNPVTGCLHGCTYCYARAITHRFPDAYPVGFTPLFHHERLDAPANTTIPSRHRDDPAYKRVFVCSMADLYGRWVPDDWIHHVHTAMLASPQWQYLLLTKFPGRYVGLDLPPTAWVGTSVDEQNRVRIAEDAFRQINDVAVKWLSLEPLREPLEFTDLSMFDWVVIGAQTETRQPDGVVPAVSPPFDWVARLYAQAQEAGCRVHMKPNLLGHPSPERPGMTLPDDYPQVS